MEEFNASPFTQRRAYVPSNPQKQDIEAELSSILEQLPLLRDELQRLDDRIEATDSVKQAFVIAEQYEIPRETALVVMNIVRQQLEMERNAIRTKVGKLIKK